MPSKRIRLEGCPCPRDPQATGRGWISAQTGWPQVPERALGSHTEPQELTFFSRLLVDRRPDKTPGFSARLESYHAEVLAAHHGHEGGLQLPVPAPGPVELDQISVMQHHPAEAGGVG